MPKKKPNSPYYKVQRKNLPGYGDTGLLSTRTTSLKRAREMEAALEWLADEMAYDVLDALRPRGRGESGRLTLADVLRARKEGRFADLRRTLSDPPLAEAVRAFASRVTYANYKLGLRHVLRLTTESGGAHLAPAGARLSWLTDARHLNLITAQLLAEGYKPNTIRVSVWHAVAQLLRHHYGAGRARDVMAEAQRPAAHDARDVWLTAADVHRVVSACEWEVRMALLVMAATGVDVGPLLRLRVRDFDAGARTLFVPDTKTASRRRTVDLAAPATLALVALQDGRTGVSNPLVTLTRGQLNYRWRLARTSAGLTTETGYRETVRLKDLRHTFAAHYLKGGGNIGALAGRMGHDREAQSLQYARHEASGSADMEGTARSLGLTLPPALVAELDRVAPWNGDTAEAAAPVEMPGWWFDRNAAPRTDDASGAHAPKVYLARGTAGWAGAGEAHRSYEERRQRIAAHPEGLASRPGDTSEDSGFSADNGGASGTRLTGS